MSARCFTRSCGKCWVCLVDAKMPPDELAARRLAKSAGLRGLVTEAEARAIVRRLLRELREDSE